MAGGLLILLAQNTARVSACDLLLFAVVLALLE